MSQRRAKRARQAARAASRPIDARKRRLRSGALIGSALVVLAAAVVGGVLAARGNGPARPVGHRSGNALELSGTDPVTGRHVDLAAFRGRPIVLNVWGSWCTECNAEAADLGRFARRHPSAQVVGVDTQDTSSGAKAFYRRWGWHHPSIADPKGEIAAQLAVQGFPTTFFLNSRHQMVTSIVGASNLAGFDQGLRLALRSNS
jgi:thiol-disulfide isomerase/thioredoxin